MLLEVRVSPGSKRPGVRVDDVGRVQVAVTAAPEKGRANDAVVVALAEALGVARSAISVVAGATARHKRVRISAFTADDLARSLRSLAANPPGTETPRIG